MFKYQKRTRGDLRAHVIVALLDAGKLREAAFAITPISGVVLSWEIELK
ncbi:MAG: hypothetical protein WD492_10175 [Alkalispirochaeta sp.]